MNVFSFMVACCAKTVIYETDEPKRALLKDHVMQQNLTNSSITTGQLNKPTVGSDLTEIKTNHFLVKIAKHGKNQSVSAVKEVNGSMGFIKIGDPLVHDDEDAAHVAKGNVPETVQDTLKAALVGVIIDKLKQSSGEVGIKNFVSNRVPLYSMEENVPRKREVTDMFVKFLEDLSKRLNLDVVTVAEQLISRSSERSEAMEMATGYARNIIPSTPVIFKPVVKYISKLVNKEIRSARLLA